MRDHRFVARSPNLLHRNSVALLTQFSPVSKFAFTIFIFMRIMNTFIRLYCLECLYWRSLRIVLLGFGLWTSNWNLNAESSIKYTTKRVYVPVRCVSCERPQRQWRWPIESPIKTNRCLCEMALLSLRHIRKTMAACGCHIMWQKANNGNCVLKCTRNGWLAGRRAEASAMHW